MAAYFERARMLELQVLSVASVVASFSANCILQCGHFILRFIHFSMTSLWTSSTQQRLLFRREQLTCDKVANPQEKWIHTDCNQRFLLGALMYRGKPHQNTSSAGAMPQQGIGEAKNAEIQVCCWNNNVTIGSVLNAHHRVAVAAHSDHGCTSNVEMLMICEGMCIGNVVVRQPRFKMASVSWILSLTDNVNSPAAMEDIEPHAEYANMADDGVDGVACNASHRDTLEDADYGFDDDDELEISFECQSIDIQACPMRILNDDNGLLSDSGCSGHLEQYPSSVNSRCAPRRHVTFADGQKLATVHRMHQWEFAYRNCRKGPWQALARDRAHFSRTIQMKGHVLEPMLAKRLEMISSHSCTTKRWCDNAGH